MISDIFENEISALNETTESVKAEYEEKLNEMKQNFDGISLISIFLLLQFLLT